MRPVIVIALAWMLMAGLVGAEATTNPPTLTVMTYNVLRPAWGRPTDPPWTARLPRIAATITASGAGIVALQEEDAAMRADLLAALPGWSGVGEVPEKGATFIVQDARWQVLDHGSTPSPGVRTIQWMRVVDAQGTAAWVFNAHFTPFEESDRVASADAVLALIQDRRAVAALPIIVCGDFNAPPSAPSYQRLTIGTDLRSAWRLAHAQTDAAAISAATTAAEAEQAARRAAVLEGLAVPKASEGYLAERAASTFHGYGPYGVVAIDHILVGPGLSVTTADIIRTAVDGILPSDHFPVVATIALAPVAAPVAADPAAAGGSR